MKGKFFILRLIGVTFALAMIGCNKSSFNELTPAGSNDLMQAQNSNQAAKLISDNYIVVMKVDVNDVDGEVDQISRNLNVKAKYRYKHAIKGFAGQLPPAAVEALSHNPKVAYIEQDQEVHLVTTQSNPPSWGLDRIDQRSLPLSNSYTYDVDGTGVDAYIIDCGILLNHSDFGGRAVTGIDEVTIGGAAIDGNGHGTHVAGTVGGNAYGVAKGVRLIAVRVLDNNGSGTTSGVIAGIDWVTNNHVSGQPAVANMSLGGGASAALDDAVRRSIADGVTYCIAAGNSSADASTASPARVTEAITVGATDINDKFAYFSNYGSVVDISAPGVNITSDWNTSSTATNTISGTSMATPHVTGAAALYLAANPSATPDAVQNAIKANGTSNKITSLPGGTVNLLLYTGTASSTPPPSTAPAAPTLSSPLNGTNNVSRTPTLTWNASTGASSYNVEVATDAGFSKKVFTKSGLTSTSTNVSPALGVRTTYYWHVSATNTNGTPWSSTWSFRTGR